MLSTDLRHELFELVFLVEPLVPEIAPLGLPNVVGSLELGVMAGEAHGRPVDQLLLVPSVDALHGLVEVRLGLQLHVPHKSSNKARIGRR